MQQIDFFLPGGGPKLPSLGDGEAIPPGPYRVGLTWCFPLERYVPPYIIVAADGRAVLGHIDNLHAAVWTCWLMNRSAGAPESDGLALMAAEIGIMAPLHTDREWRP